MLEGILNSNTKMVNNQYYYALILSSLFFVDYASAQPLSLEWAKQIGGDGQDICHSITLDDSNNILSVGLFEGTVDFDPGAGIQNLISNQYADIYVQKIDNQGELLWVRQISGPGYKVSRNIKTDNLGNSFITGLFNGIASFDTGSGQISLNSFGGSDIFIQKLNSHGNIEWIKQIGGASYDDGESLTVDAMGNVYIIGHFVGVVDFDPGEEVYNLESTSDSDMFILKLNSNGEFIWVKNTYGEGSFSPKAIEIDNLSDLIILGRFTGTFDFAPDETIYGLTSNGESDIVILKLNNQGNFIWAKHFGGENRERAGALAVDNQGNIYNTGTFRGVVDFDPEGGTQEFSSLGDSDIYIQKLNNSGGLVWVKHLGGNSVDISRSIIVDEWKNVYTTGFFSETVDFATGPEIFNLSSQQYEDVYIHVLDEFGGFIYVKQISGWGHCGGQAISINNIDNSIYTAGFFTNSIEFDVESSSINFNTNFLEDVYIAKYNSIISNTNDLRDNETNIQIFPNPTISKLIIKINNDLDHKIIITDTKGNLIWSKKNVSEKVEIDVSHFVNGLYFLTFQNSNDLFSKKFIKK